MNIKRLSLSVFLGLVLTVVLLHGLSWQAGAASNQLSVNSDPLPVTNLLRNIPDRGQSLAQHRRQGAISNLQSLVSSPQSTTRYVATTGADGGNNCANSAAPCATVQHAVDQATSGDEIRIAGGVYNEVQGRPAPPAYDFPPASGVINQVVFIAKTLTLRGGYTTTNWTVSNPISYPTTLDAHGQGRVVYISPEIHNTRLENLTLTGGDAAGLGGLDYGGSSTYDAGGGIFMAEYGTGEVISGCTLVSNTTGSQHWGAGGAIAKHGGSLTLQNNRILSNTVPRGGDDANKGGKGGGVFLDYVEQLTFTGNELAWNRAPNRGGGLYHDDGRGLSRIHDNEIHHNQVTAHTGGGLYIYIPENADTLVLTNNHIFSNTAGSNGGGAWILGRNSPVIVGNRVYGNSAKNGGGFYMFNEYASGSSCCISFWEMTFERNLIMGNHADNEGGGLYLTGSDSDFKNNVIADNDALGQGSGMYLLNSNTLRFLHTTLARNTGEAGVYAIAWTWNDCSHSTFFTNTIIYSHTTGVINGNSSNGSVDMNYTFWGRNGTNNSGGVGDEHPFIGALTFEADGYHVVDGSDTIDAGTDARVTSDVDEQPRPMGDFPDLGADEYALWADFSLTKTRLGSGPVAAGGVITYALTVANPSTSTWRADARLTDILSPTQAVAALRASVPGGTCQTAGAVLTCDLFNIVTGTERTVTLIVTTSNNTAATVDYASGSGLNLAIPDNGCGGGSYLESVISVGSGDTVQDVDITLVNLVHTFDGDLQIFLRGPDGTQVELSTGNGGGGDNYIDTVFDDEAGTPITSGSAPFTGRFQPEGSLAGFDGKSQGGDWTLRICDNSSLDVGALNEWALMFVVPGEELTLVNTASVVALDAIDANDGNNAAGPVTVTITSPTPDPWVDKAASAQYVKPGESLFYTVTWGNRGAIDAENAVLTDTLPNEVTYLGASPAPDTVTGKTLVWSLGNVSAAAGATYYISTSVLGGLADGTVLTNTALIAASTGDDPPLNNTSVATTTVYDLGGVNLTVEKTATPNEVKVGENIEYIICIKNTGFVEVEPDMNDPIPLGTEYVAGSAVADKGTVAYNVFENKVTWEGELAPGEEANIGFIVKVVSCTGEICGLVRNVATVKVPNVSAPWDAHVDTIVRCPDLTVQVGAPYNVNRFSSGNFNRYTAVLNWENKDDHNSPGIGYQSRMTVTVSSGAEFSAANPQPTTRINPQTWVWDLGDLNPGQKGTINVEVTPQQWVTGGYVVKAKFYAKPKEECTPNGPNEAEARAHPAAINLKKSAGSPKFVVTPGLNPPFIQQEYTIRYRYQNPASSVPPVTSLLISDTLPTNFEPTEVRSQPQVIARGATHFQYLVPMYPEDGGFIWFKLQAPLYQDSTGKDIINHVSGRYNIQSTSQTTETFTDTAQVKTSVPLFPPGITFPGSGEMCPGTINIKGVSQPGTEVLIFDGSTQVATASVDANGKFNATYSLQTGISAVLSAKARLLSDPSQVSAASNVVTLNAGGWAPAWDPQTSFWGGIIKAGPLKGNTYDVKFKNTAGLYATNGWQAPGVYGFWDSLLGVNGCGCEINETQVFTVVADGRTYEPFVVANTLHSFMIGSAHTIQIQSQCRDSGGGGEIRVGHGEVLIDPDGFIFDVNEGGDYDAATGMFSPVQAIPGVTVTAYMSYPQWGGWVPWPAHMYDQVNPQNTNITYSDGITTSGYYAFFTPPGFYYIQVDGYTTEDGTVYQPWRSPVVEVITEIVHVNVPYTPIAEDAAAYTITLTADGPSSAVITIPVGSTVNWISTLRDSDTITDILTWSENPILHPLSDLNPLENTLGWDGGFLEPGRVYQRRFNQGGTYTYTDGAGHSGKVIVISSSTSNKIYLPIIFRNE